MAIEVYNDEERKRLTMTFLADRKAQGRGATEDEVAEFLQLCEASKLSADIIDAVVEGDERFSLDMADGELLYKARRRQNENKTD
jgi:hypothetical protein